MIQAQGLFYRAVSGVSATKEANKAKTKKNCLKKIFFFIFWDLSESLKFNALLLLKLFRAIKPGSPPPTLSLPPLTTICILNENVETKKGFGLC